MTRLRHIETSVGRHRLTSRVIATSWDTSETYYLLLELCFCPFALSRFIHFRIGQPLYLFPVSVDNERCRIVMGYEAVFDGGPDKMKNTCIFADVRLFLASYDTEYLGRQPTFVKQIVAIFMISIH